MVIFINMKLSEAVAKQKHSGELSRIRKLFLKGFNQFLSGKSRDVRLDFVEDVLSESLSKSDIKFLILRLQKGFNRK